MEQTKALKILIVDDEEIVRYTLGEIIRMTGHTPDHEEDALAGLRAIQNTTYDVAFVDKRMPGMDGIQLLQQALAIQPNLSIIIMSGNSDTQTRMEAMQAGAFSFLSKPFQVKDVIDIIKRASQNKDSEKP